MAKQPPIKLDWYEAVTDWLAGLDEDRSRPQLPEKVSRSAMLNTVGMVMRATTSSTNEALVSTQWLETMTGHHHSQVAAKALKVLEDYGWIRWTQRTRNKAKWYELTVPPVGIIYPHSSPRGDTPGGDDLSPPESFQSLPGGDSGGDSGGDDLSPTPVLPYSRRRDRPLKREEVQACSECGLTATHTHDCSQRPFEDSSVELDFCRGCGGNGKLRISDDGELIPFDAEVGHVEPCIRCDGSGRSS